MLRVTPARDGPPDMPSLPLGRPECPAGARLRLPQGREGEEPPLPAADTRSPPSLGTPPPGSVDPSLVLPAPSREGRGGKGQSRGRAEGARLPGSWHRHCSHALWCQSWHRSPAPPLPCGDQGTRNVAVDSVPWGHGFLSQWARAEDGFPPFDPCQLQGAGRAQALPGRPQGKLGGGPRRVPHGFLIPVLPAGWWSWPLPSPAGPGQFPSLGLQVPHSSARPPACLGGAGPRLTPPDSSLPARVLWVPPTTPHPLLSPPGVPGAGQGAGPGGNPGVLASPLPAKEPACRSPGADPKALTLKCARFPPFLASLSLRQSPCHSGDLVFKCYWASPTLGQGGGAERVSSGAPERQKDPGGQLASAWPPLPVVPRVPSPARWKSQQLAPPPRGLSGACSIRPTQPRRGDSSWAPPAEEGGAQTPGRSSWPLGTFLRRSGLCMVSQQGSGVLYCPPCMGTLPSQWVLWLWDRRRPGVSFLKGVPPSGGGRGASQAGSSGAHRRARRPAPTEQPGMLPGGGTGQRPLAAGGTPDNASTHMKG